MQYLASLLALASAVAAQTAGFDAITNPGEGATLTKGQSFNIEWQYNADFPGTSKIVLIGGTSPSTLDTVETITESVDNAAGHFTWTVDTSGDAVYGFQIIYNEDASVFQYSFPFSIAEGSGSSSSSSSSSSAAGTKSSGGYGSWPATTSTSGPKPSGSGSWPKPTSTYGGNGSWPHPTGTSCETDSATYTWSWTTSTSQSAPVGGATTAANSPIPTAGAATTKIAAGAALVGALAMAALAL